MTCGSIASPVSVNVLLALSLSVVRKQGRERAAKVIESEAQPTPVMVWPLTETMSLPAHASEPLIFRVSAVNPLLRVSAPEVSAAKGEGAAPVMVSPKAAGPAEKFRGDLFVLRNLAYRLHF